MKKSASPESFASNHLIDLLSINPRGGEIIHKVFIIQPLDTFLSRQCFSQIHNKH